MYGVWVLGADYERYRPHETLSFSLVPADFFTENPSIDVPSERNLSAKEVVYQGGLSNGVNGAVNGVSNGVTNGHANGSSNGHTNGDANEACCGGH